MPHVFIAIEGLDGTGKSTVCQLLAKRMSAVLLRSGEAVPASLRAEIDANGSLETRFFMYSFGVASLADQVVNHLQDRTVVVDRWIHSTIAYHRALGSEINQEQFRALLDLPDYAFSLRASTDTRRARMAKRELVLPNDELFMNPRLALEVDRTLMTLGCMPLNVDASTPDEVVDTILGHINAGSRTQCVRARPHWRTGARAPVGQDDAGGKATIVDEVRGDALC